MEFRYEGVKRIWKFIQRSVGYKGKEYNAVMCEAAVILET